MRSVAPRPRFYEIHATPTPQTRGSPLTDQFIIYTSRDLPESTATFFYTQWTWRRSLFSSSCRVFFISLPTYSLVCTQYHAYIFASLFRMLFIFLKIINFLIVYPCVCFHRHACIHNFCAINFHTSVLWTFVSHLANYLVFIILFIIFSVFNFTLFVSLMR